LPVESQEATEELAPCLELILQHLKYVFGKYQVIRQASFSCLWIDDPKSYCETLATNSLLGKGGIFMIAIKFLLSISIMLNCDMGCSCSDGM
jgi:hypothetical protein